jgi:DNA-binding response OmpR family regulator
MRILLVDKDSECRRILADQLEDLDHEVFEADNGREGWMTLKVQGPRVVITDLALAEYDGFELCRKIRRATDLKYAYIIILTSEASKLNFLQAMSAGADDFLGKPCVLTDIVLRLRVAERLLQLKSKVNQLQGLLPICSYCKKIRDDREEWHPVDLYVNQRSGVSFSQCVCPDCYHDYIEPQFEQILQSRPVAVISAREPR